MSEDTKEQIVSKKRKLFFYEVLEQEGFSFSKWDWRRMPVIDDFFIQNDMKTIKQAKDALENDRRISIEILGEGEHRGRQYFIFRGGAKKPVIMLCYSKKGICTGAIQRKTKTPSP